MTLGEAIKHLEEKIQEDNFPCEECRKEHLDLLDWLEELRDSRILINNIKKALMNSNVSNLNCKNRDEKFDPLE